MGLIRLLYRSDSELTGSDRSLREVAFAIADAAAVRNAEVGVTGALMFTRGVFVQLLEGESSAVETVFERICRDLRHRRLVLLDFSKSDAREFASWNMVAFEGDERTRAEYPVLGEATSFAQRNPRSVNTTVQIMRDLLAKRLAKQAPTASARLSATDVLG